MFYPMLFENPNAIYLDKFDTVVDWTQIKSLAFSYYNDLMYVGSSRATHRDVYKGLKLKDELADKREGRGKYAGRIFEVPKVITFWDFPETNSVLMQILKDIEEETTFHFDDSWRIEVPKAYQKDDDKMGGWGTWHPKKNSQEFIPISKYNGGFARSEQEMQRPHIMPPIEKERSRIANPDPTPRVRGFGADKTAWDTPNNIKSRQAKQTSESLKRK